MLNIVFALSLFGHNTLHTHELDWPLQGEITSKYGPRWGKIHHGLDIAAPEGRWVRAAESGKVTFAAEYGGYGNLVAVRHGGGLKTYYAHLQNYCVFPWQRVRKGQRLGRVGVTGNVTGPHLHFEVHVNGSTKDPLDYLPRRPEYQQPGIGAVGGP